MDIKTVYGFIMVGAGFLFQSVADYIGINGNVDATLSAVIAAGLFLISGKEIYNKTINK